MKKLFIALLLFCAAFVNAQVKPLNYIEMENEIVKVRFDKTYGRLIYMEYKKNSWILQKRDGLSHSFRLLVPTEKRRDNTVMGNRIKLEKYELSDNGNKLTLVWKNLSSDDVPALDIRFTGEVELISDGIEFTAKIDNRSSLRVDAVFWPYLGDLSFPDKADRTTWLKYGYAGSLQEAPISPVFRSDHGYWGVDYPLQTHKTHYAHFGLLQTKNQGLYAEYQDTTTNCLVTFNFELKPGFEYPEGMQSGTVPRADTINGQPVHIEFSCTHYAYVLPATIGKLKPIVLKPYTGDWHNGVDLYKEWRASWKRDRSLPAWAQEVHSWQQIHINSPEDRPVFMYKDLVNYCKECSTYNVKAIQLTGWDEGGQDRGDPSANTEPKLGTREDLKTAISKCQEMGVKIILFNKYTWADKSTEWFKEEMYKYTAKDPYGDHYQTPGYQYQSITQLQGFNSRKLMPLCPLSADWRKIANREFTKVMDLGAAGMLYDENQHHGGVFYCFDPTHGHKVPANVFEGDAPLAQGFLDIANKKNPDFLFVGEGCRDLQFYYYPISYFRIGTGYTPMLRYALPTEKMMVAVIGHNDRNTINQCLMFNFIISYEPRNFKGKLSEFPLTVDYGNKVDALRSNYKDILWDGIFMDKIGATVLSENKPYNHYTVFRHKSNGRKAIVISNPNLTSSVFVTVKTETSGSGWIAVSPEDQVEKDFGGSVDIPPMSVVVIMKK